MNIKDIKQMAPSELTKTLREQKEELFNLRFQHSINQLDNPMKRTQRQGVSERSRLR